jgi:hypothetical protein
MKKKSVKKKRNDGVNIMNAFSKMFTSKRKSPPIPSKRVPPPIPSKRVPPPKSPPPIPPKRPKEENKEEGLPIEIIGEVISFLNKDDFLYLIHPPEEAIMIEGGQYPSKEELLKITNLVQLNVEVQFTLLIIFFVIYDTYVSGTEIDIDLQKKLMLFFCLEEEKEKRETLLVSLLEINRKITTENFNLSEATREQIKTEKQKIERHVENYYLIKENDTAADGVFYKDKKIIVDCTDNKFQSINDNLVGKGVTFYVKANSQVLNILDQAVVYGFDTAIGDRFCSNLNRLKSIKFFLPLLEKVGHFWLMGNKSLKDVDFTGLTSLEKVGNYWLYENESLTEVNFTGLTSLEKVGNYWLCENESLTEVNFTGLTSLKEVGGQWLKNNLRLIKVILTDLKSLETVGDEWLTYTNLTDVDFTGLTYLKKVGNFWLCQNNSLTRVNFTGLTSLQTVGNFWLMGNKSLKDVDFTGLTSLETVGNYWLMSNESLITVILTGLTSLQTVGYAWLSQNKSLTTVDFSGLTSLKTVGGAFMSNSNNINDEARRFRERFPSSNNKRSIDI